MTPVMGDFSASSLPALTASSDASCNIIDLTGIEMHCVIGCYAEERHAPQPLVLDIRLELEPTAVTRLEHTLDYVRIAGMARFLLQRGRFLLLESAALALCRAILAPPTRDAPRPLAVVVRMIKPRALGGQGVPSITVVRRAEDLRLERQVRPFGEVDVLYEGEGLGLYRRRIAAGRSIAARVHPDLERHELILGSELVLQGQRVRPGLAFHWPRNHLYRYDNPGAVEQSVLCLDRPPLAESDEREVVEPAAGLGQVPGETFFSTAQPITRDGTIEP